MKDLEEIHADLLVCLNLLEEAGAAYREDREEEFVSNLVILAPRLQRATNALGQIVDGKEESLLLDQKEVSFDLDGIQRLWGHTVTGTGWGFVSDGISIVRSQAIIQREFYQDIENARNEVQSTLSAIKKYWNNALNSLLVNASWGGVNREPENPKAILRAGNFSVEVDAGRFAALWDMCLFDRIQVSFEEQFVVFWRKNQSEPVAMMLYQEETRDSYEEIGTDSRSPELG